MNQLNGLGIPYSVSLVPADSLSDSERTRGDSSPLPGQLALPFLGQSQQSLAKYLVPSSRKDGRLLSSPAKSASESRKNIEPSRRPFLNLSTRQWSSVKFKAWTQFLNKRRVK